MNPDPNQPQAPAPAPEVPQQPQPQVPVTPQPTPVVEPVPVIVPTPVDPITPNPFGGAPVTPAAPTPISAQPATTIGSSPNNNPAPDFNKASKRKKLIILIGAIVGALIVLGVVAFILFTVFTASKKDYAAAATQFDVVSTADSQLQTDTIAVEYDINDSSTDTKFNNDVDIVNSDLTKIQTENTKLSTLKAVKLGDGKKLYDTFNTKLTAYSAYVKDQISSVKSYRPAVVACGDTTSTTAAEEQSHIGACITALSGATNVPNSDLKTFVAAELAGYQTAQSILNQMLALKDPYGKDYNTFTSLEDQLNTAEDKVTAAETDYSSNVTKHDKDNDPVDAANALSDLLSKKSL